MPLLVLPAFVLEAVAHMKAFPQGQRRRRADVFAQVLPQADVPSVSERLCLFPGQVNHALAAFHFVPQERPAFFRISAGTEIGFVMAAPDHKIIRVPRDLKSVFLSPCEQ